MFVLSDRAGWGLQNFCTELWNSLIMQIYANLFKINEKCYISSISQRILIMFVLSDRAGWGLQNFCTELWNSLIMQIYAIFFKINEKCYIFSISQRILIMFVLSDRAGWGASKLLHRVVTFINYANLCKFIQNQWKMLHLLYFAADFDYVCFYLIGLGGGFKISTLNCEIHYLCKFMQIYSKSMKNATSPLFRNGFWLCLFYLIGLGGGFKTSALNCEIN